MKKQIYRTGGASLVLYLIFDAIFLAIPFIALPGLIHSFSNGDITYILGDLASLFLVIHLTTHLVTNKIILTGDSLFIKETDIKLFFRNRSIGVPLKEIKTMYLGNETYLRGKLEGNKPGLDELKWYLERFVTGRAQKSKKNPMSSVPVFVLETTGGKYFVAGTRPYAKSQMKQFLDELAALSVHTSVQENVI